MAKDKKVQEELKIKRRLETLFKELLNVLDYVCLEATKQIYAQIIDDTKGQHFACSYLRKD